MVKVWRLIATGEMFYEIWIVRKRLWKVIIRPFNWLRWDNTRAISLRDLCPQDREISTSRRATVNDAASKGNTREHTQVSTYHFRMAPVYPDGRLRSSRSQRRLMPTAWLWTVAARDASRVSSRQQIETGESKLNGTCENLKQKKRCLSE